MPKKEYIIAPAGHGKTEQIVDLVSEYADGKRVLVLTHTNAGISSLRKRFRKKSVESNKYDIYTIDSFAVRYARAYPYTSEVGEIPTTNTEYENCREGAKKVFDMKFLQNFIKERYSLILIDEYQDCSESQHQLIMKISEGVDCIILGDPMQAIFDFGGCNLVKWEDIRNVFAKHPTDLPIPHRWTGGNEELGEWTKETREKIINGEEISFENAKIDLIKISDRQDKINPIFRALEAHKEVLILVNDGSKDGNIKKDMAKNYHGMVQIIDALDFPMFYKFLKDLSSTDEKIIFEALINFFKSCLTKSSHFESKITNKVKKLWDSKSPKTISELRKEHISTRGEDCEERGKQINKLYHLFLDVLETNGIGRAKAMIILMENIEKFIKKYKPNEKGYIFRKDIWDSIKNSLNSYIFRNGDGELEDHGRKIRQRTSFIGRGFRKVIGTTLLTKGLEYEHVIIDGPESLDAKHLYVALSRAKSKITIFSEKVTLKVQNPENI